jgi:hypothetical protein
MSRRHAHLPLYLPAYFGTIDLQLYLNNCGIWDVNIAKSSRNAENNGISPHNFSEVATRISLVGSCFTTGLPSMTDFGTSSYTLKFFTSAPAYFPEPSSYRAN